MLKTKILIGLFLWVQTNFAQPIPLFEQAYQQEYAEGQNWIRQNGQLIGQELGDESVFLMAVVFPEMVRYAEWRNVLETKSLELGYIQYGKQWADFSIGYFQIKPSFVEYLETQRRYVRLSPDQSAYLNLDSKTGVAARRERLDRLKTISGQLKYLAIFYRCWKAHYPFIQHLSLEKRLKMCATAYNSGLHHSQQELEQLATQTYFPYGKRYKGNQYNYSEIAWHFYQSFNLKIVPSLH